MMCVLMKYTFLTRCITKEIVEKIAFDLPQETFCFQQQCSCIGDNDFFQLDYISTAANELADINKMIE